jgi:LysR family hydrogen peroxide-inducible transcriptional activator
MKNLTLRQLRYFEALARHGHFGRAAEACAVSQPALSLQIMDLEDSLGAELFERSPRQVRLTRFGEDFAPRVRDILRAVEELGDLARASQGWLSGRLRIGIIPTVAPYLLPGIVGRLNHLHPGLDIHIRETLTARLLRELSEGRLDAAILALPVAAPALTEAPLFAEEFLFVRPLEDAGKPVPNIDMLKDMRLLLLEEGHCFRDQALAFCDIASSLPREVLEGSSLSTLVQMVGAGIGVTFIPELAAPIETRSAAVSLARFADPKPSRTIGMVWRRSSPLAGQLQTIADTVRHVADELRAAALALQPA